MPDRPSFARSIDDAVLPRTGPGRPPPSVTGGAVRFGILPRRVITTAAPPIAFHIPDEPDVDGFVDDVRVILPDRSG